MEYRHYIILIYFCQLIKLLALLAFLFYFLIVVALPTLPSTDVLNVSIKLTTVAEKGVCKPALRLSYVSPP